MPERRLQDVFFYSLESAIKSYRRFAQARVQEKGFDITIDQWLVLKTIEESPAASQQKIAAVVFKDFASVTRIIQLLESKGYVRRRTHQTDGRRSSLRLTRAGVALIRDLEPVIRANRRQALEGLTAREIERMREKLALITANCRPRLRET
jgi:MarR family transcriptional regulator, transcriptional regulator for hemolysin